MRRSPESGRISFVSMLLLTGLVAGGYLAIVYVPLYVDNYQLKRVMQEAANLAWKQPDDDALRKLILSKSANVGARWVVEEGRDKKIPGFGLLADNIFVTRDEATKTVIVQINYEREIILPIFARKQTLSFNPYVQVSTAEVKWE